MSGLAHTPQLIEVCMVANLQTVGPTFITAVKGDIFDESSGMLLAARIVITSGMGDTTSGIEKLNGPIPVPELNLDKEYACYFIPMNMTQKTIPEEQFSTGQGSFIICLIISEKQKDIFHSFENLMENSLKMHLNKIDFSKSITGDIPNNLKNNFLDILKEIYNETNDILKIAYKFQGGSLFDIGLIVTLPEALGQTAKKLMLNPKGLLEQEINDKNALKTLIQAGLVEKEERAGQVWVIPR